MNKKRLILGVLVMMFSLAWNNISGTGKVERFEHLDSRDGLSQNAVLSIFCDSKGYIWMGTMDGLNRYDGYNFRIFKAIPGSMNSLTNNRVSLIWEDLRNYIWVVTYDGYVHRFDPAKEEFRTIPFYFRSEEEKNSHFTCFYQENRDEIWVGTSRSGVYHLEYDSVMREYTVNRYVSRGTNAITNNEIHFVVGDCEKNLWIGTRQGLNKLDYKSRNTELLRFEHFSINLNFTVAASMDQEMWFGTSTDGVRIYDCRGNSFTDADTRLQHFRKKEITVLERVGDDLFIGTASDGMYSYNNRSSSVEHYQLKGHHVKGIYEDLWGKVWVTTNEFGISYLNPEKDKARYFQLTPDELKTLVDDERQYFFEDTDSNLWIGLHGAGLALFNRNAGSFTFYRNNPRDPFTISSNFVHCITQDKSGMIWLGTGQINGGVNKAIPANPLFLNMAPVSDIKDMADNVIRCTFQDRNRNIWAATKSGLLFIYDSTLREIAVLRELPLEGRNLPGYNIYSMVQDSEGYMWLGSKGGGVAVSMKPLQYYKNKYSNIRFRIYQYNDGDTASLSGNNIYSIIEDRNNNIWIGTYGTGLSLVLEREGEKMTCRRINTQNSNISANEVRNLFEDSRGRIWVATTFGLNKINILNDSIYFDYYTYSPTTDSSISYNDIVHIFESSNGTLWFATFGGGINQLLSGKGSKVLFRHYNHTNGLVNDAVFGILEDKAGNLWLSTEGGLSRFNPVTLRFDNYGQQNGLTSDRFSENTCARLKDGRLVFGSTGGLLIVNPENLAGNTFLPPIVFTNFQLFNQTVDIHAPDAPIHLAPDYLTEIELKHYQSSFSIGYAALNFADPEKNAYQFMLEGFEEEWNDVGSLTRATYTNLPPGKYKFMVRVLGSDGNWGTEARSVDIVIHPPWYRTVWAFVLYGFLLIILADIARRILLRFYRMRRDLMVERKVNDIKLQFFTNISHEIRTPLTLILGPLADIKAHDKLTPSLKKSVEIMDRSGKRMLRLVNQLLDFRKIQKGKMQLKVRTFDLIEFLREIYQNFNHLAEQKNIQFTFKSEIETLTVFADPDKLDSVLFNVLSNAFKFTPGGKKIDLSVVKPDGGFVEVYCNDEGSGIPADKLPALFQRYTTLSSGNFNYQGTGIGLALSYEIMKLHGGEIEATSEENVGTSFKIRIKLGSEHFTEEDAVEDVRGTIIPGHRKLDEDEENGYDTAETFENLNQDQDYTILIAEDNEEIIGYIRHILENDFKLLVAGNGKEALDMINKSHPDLIITDIMMPVMDGIEFTRSVKENFESSHIPVIMLTAKSTVEDQIHGIESGAEAYILKPFDAAYLRAVITNILRQREIIMKRFFNRGPMPEGIRITGKDEKFMSDVEKIIKEHYSDPEFNVEQLVELSNVGRTVFYNKIKGLTGIAPVVFLRNMRLKIASGLIIESGYNISEAGYMTGFNDIKYFSKCFKNYFGLTPSEFKNKYQQKSHNPDLKDTSELN